MIKKLICAAALLMVAGLQHTRAQYVYGTTAVSYTHLTLPTSDLQVAATPKHWNYDTWNYYINITLFPWLEVGYTCTLHKIGLPQYGYSYKFRNQDRQFSARLRVWKEGWWKEWTPQILPPTMCWATPIRTIMVLRVRLRWVTDTGTAIT